MPTIIDELIVTLGLDPTNYGKGAREKETADKKIRDSNRGLTREMETTNKRAGESFSKLKNEAVGLFLTFAGASSVTSFIGNILSGDAATGRLAKNLGIATNELSAWELALKTVGGTAQDADGALSKISSLFYQYKTGQLDAQSGGLLNSLGIYNPEDLEKPQTALLKLAEAADRFNAQGKQAEFRQRMLQLGISEPMINLLSQGRGAVEKLIAEKKRDAAASQENADKASQFQKALADLEARITNQARPAVYGLVQGLLDLDAKFGLINIAAPIATGLIVALGVGALRALGPIGWLAAAVGTLWSQIANWPPEATKGWSIIGDMLGKGDVSGAASLLWQSAKDLVAETVSGKKPGTPSPSFSQTSSGNSGGGGSNADWFRAHGLSDAQARGVAAGIHAESGGNPNARNKSSGAFGIGQWLGPRKARLFAKYGPNPSLDQQREFLLWELNGGDHGGAAVRGASTDTGALDAYIDKFMRPAQGAETIGDKQRGRAFLGQRSAAGRPSARAGSNPNPIVKDGTYTTSIGEIKVFTQATDANGIARDLRGAIAHRTTTAQANQGLE